jgi:hypothetical protein
MNISKAKRVYDTIIEYMKSKFTGCLKFEIHMNQGGITKAKKNIEDEVE